MITRALLPSFFGACALVLGTLVPSVSFAAPTSISCVPAGVASSSSLVHVECATPVGGIKYFALPVAAKDEANRLISLASTALVAGRTLGIWYDPADTTTGPTFGCASANCRRVLSIDLR